MPEKRTPAHFRMLLLDRLSAPPFTKHTVSKIAPIIANSVKSKETEERDAEAACKRMLELLKDCQTEEQVLEKLSSILV